MTQPTMIQNRKTQADVLSKGFGVQKDMLEMQSKMPPPGQNYIDMFSGMRDSVGFKQRPRSPWRAALDGMFKGLEVGAKIGKNSEAKERYQKLEQFGEYVEENQRALNKDLAVEQKKIATNESLGKIADPLFLMSKSGASPEEMNQVAREQFELARDHGLTIETRDPQTGEVKASTEEFIPKGASFRSVDPISLTVTYVKPDGTTGHFDGNKYVTPGAIEKHKLNLEEKKAATHSKWVDFQTDENRDKTNSIAAQAQAKENVKTAKELEAKVKNQQIFLGHLDDMEKFITEAKNKKLTGSTFRAEYNRWAAKRFGYDEQSLVENIDMLGKDFIAEGKSLFGSRLTNFDLTILQQMMATIDKNPDASLKQIQRYKEKLRPEVEGNTNQLRELQKNPAAQIHTPEAASIHTKGGATMMKGKKIIKAQTAEQVEGLKANGWEQAEEVDEDAPTIPIKAQERPAINRGQEVTNQATDPYQKALDELKKRGL